MFRNLFSRTDVFLLFINFLTFLNIDHNDNMQSIKKAIITFALGTILQFLFFFEDYYSKQKFHHKKINTENFSKIANQQPSNQSPPTTFQENPTTPTNTQNPQSSTHISFQDNQNSFEERHARLSEALEPVVHQAPLSEPQYEPTYNIHPPLQRDLNRVRNFSQNQITLEINRQIIHPGRNRNF